MGTTKHDEETHPLATAEQIARVLYPDAAVRPVAVSTDRDGNVILTNAQARRLLVLARRGAGLGSD